MARRTGIVFVACTLLACGARLALAERGGTGWPGDTTAPPGGEGAKGEPHGSRGQATKTIPVRRAMGAPVRGSKLDLLGTVCHAPNKQDVKAR